MYQISMDLPSVSLNFLRQVQKYWVVNEFHELINIASCGLHTIHNAFVVEAMNWNIKNIFQESSDSRAGFESIFSSWFTSSSSVQDGITNV